MGILEKTRALLLSKLTAGLRDNGADERAIKDLILELEHANADITKGIAGLVRQVDYAENRPEAETDTAQLNKLKTDIREGEEELRRVNESLAEMRIMLAAAKRSGEKTD